MKYDLFLVEEISFDFGEKPQKTLHPVAKGLPDWQSVQRAVQEYCAAHGGIEVLAQEYKGFAVNRRE